MGYEGARPAGVSYTGKEGLSNLESITLRYSRSGNENSMSYLKDAYNSRTNRAYLTPLRKY